jgi:ankyrin repeat protein
MTVASKGDAEMAKLLIAKGADVNSKAEIPIPGKNVSTQAVFVTPVKVATQWKRPEVIKVLKEAGAKE